MAVIAMTQEMATLGKDVALGVCEALGLQQVRHEVGDVVAGKMKVKKSLIRRIREGKASKIEKWSADEKTMSIFTAEEVLDLAVKGNVLIRGWGATLLLRPIAHIPSIQVCSPMELRIQRLMLRLETDDVALARREIETDDAARAARMGEHFNVHWGDPALYDLTLNTERIPTALCVDLIVALAKSKEFQPTPESLRQLSDLAVAARVRAALKASDKTAQVDIAVEASAGVVTLTGIVMDDRERGACEEVAAQTAGVASVDNRIKTMSGGLYRFPSQPRSSDD